MCKETDEFQQRSLSSKETMATSFLVGFYQEIFIAIICFLCLFLRSKKHRKHTVPTNWPILGMLPAILANLNHLHDWYTELLKGVGCTFKFHGPWFLSMDFLVTCDPANVNHVFNTNFSNYPKGEEFLEIFDILGDGIFNVDGETWKMQRKKAHGVFSSTSYRSFVARCTRDKVENGLVPLMSQLTEQEAVVDLQDVFMRVMFDITCNLVFGVDPGCLSIEFPTIPFARAMDDAMEAMFFRHLVPPQCWKLMRRLRIGKERKLSAAWRVMDEFVAQNIAKKRESKIYGEDLLTSYIESKEQLDDKFLRDTTVTLMLAGRDASGITLTWFFWLLSKNPEVKSKILEELQEKLYQNKMHRLVLDPEQISKLVYLHAALCESLRLFPPVPFEHKGTLQPDTLPSGNQANSKEKIVFTLYSMARVEGIWGKDCSEFKPERWISKQGSIKHEPSYKFLSFNCGPRACLGKDIAFTQMKTVAAGVMCNFDVEMVEGHVVEPKPSIILHMKNGLLVGIKKKGQLNKIVRND